MEGRGALRTHSDRSVVARRARLTMGGEAGGGAPGGWCDERARVNEARGDVQLLVGDFVKLLSNINRINRHASAVQ